MNTTTADPAAWVPPVLGGLLPADRLATVVADYPRHRDVPLAQLGIDSMSIMGIVLNLETALGVPIDYETFDIAVLRTLGTIERYLAESGADRPGSGRIA